MPDVRRAFAHPQIIYHGVALLLVLFSFVMAAALSRTVFERLPHLEDEFTHLFQARIFARGDVVVDIPNPRRSYWQPFIIDFAETGARFGKYPPGWSSLLAIGVKMDQPWVINAFFGALSVALAYRLGRDLFNVDVGLAAAALLAFSPMSLLLNASLMGHTSALFFVTLFMWAYLRMERQSRPAHAARWALLAGLALGMVLINRPLTGVGVAIPFVIISGLRLLRAAYRRLVPATNLRTSNAPLMRLFVPLALLAFAALVVSVAIPLYNHATTGDASQNLYTLVWSYDRVGFGENFGRNGHTIIKGIRHTRFDLSLTAADLFGWQFEPVTDALKTHLATSASFWPPIGLSFFILPIGLFIGLRSLWGRVWLAVALVWLIYPLAQDMDFLRDSESQITIWLLLIITWMLIPPLIATIRPNTRLQWTWLLLAVPATLVFFHLAYWVGSQRYTTRYYFEGLSAAALIGALPVAWLARRMNRPLVFGAFALVLLWSLITYSLPRIDALHRFNFIGPEVADDVRERLNGDQPALVIVTGAREDVRWRAFGSLMAYTSPFLDSDIVVAWDYAPGTNIRDLILENHPDRQVIEMSASGNEAWFPATDCTPTSLQNCVETSTN